MFHFLVWIVFFIRPTSLRLAHKAEKENLSLRIARAELATRIVSIVHAIITSVVSFLLILKDPIVSINNPSDFSGWPKLELTSPMATNLCLYSLSYFVADFMLCSILFKENGFPFWIHAAIGCASSSFAAFGQFGHVFVGPLYLWEGSTPFLNIRWILAEYGLKNNPIYILNGLILIIAFFTFRLILGIPLCIKIIMSLNDEEHQNSLDIKIRVIFSLAFTCTMILNSVWGYGLLSGFIRALSKTKVKVKQP